MKNLKEQIIIFWIYLIITSMVDNISSQSTNIILKEGTIVGIKVFPETSKLPVYVYLGIPYAEPPVGNLRFAVINGFGYFIFLLPTNIYIEFSETSSSKTMESDIIHT